MPVKRILLLVLFAARCLPVFSQTNAPTGTTVPAAQTVLPIPGAYTPGAKINYVRTWEPRKRITNPLLVPAQTVADVKQTTAYVDGLGRPIQTVAKQISPLQKDMVAYKTLDDYGREQVQYLPYVAAATDGQFKSNPFQEQQTYYTTGSLNNNQYTGESVYYGQTVFENAPLGRTEKSMAPGNSWAGSGRGVSMQYMTNTTADAVRLWTVGDAEGSVPGTAGTYGAGQLYKSVTVDEHGKQVAEYKDKKGLVVLKKVQIASSPGAAHTGWLCTYYIYDDYDQLRMVIQPRAVEIMNNSDNWSLSAHANVINELCFRYEYDSRNRMIIKKVPGAGEVWMVYDKQDKLLFSQDAAMRTKNQWLATLYDGLERPVMTGMYTTTLNRQDLQNHVNTASATSTQSYSGNTGQFDAYITDYVSNTAAYIARNSISFTGEYTADATAEFTAYIDPSASSTSTQAVVNNFITGTFSALTTTTYDEYPATNSKTFTSAENSKLNITGDPLDYLPATANNSTRGIAVESRVRVLEDPDNFNSGSWLTSTSFYDDRGRMIQVQADNYKGGTDIQSTLYDFTGKALITYLVHKNPASGGTVTKVKTTMEYDHAGRILNVWKTINDNETKKALIVSNAYDELGQLKQKKVGQQKNTNGSYSSNPLETLDYTYNIRGWLKSINKDYANGLTAAGASWFGMELNYDGGFTSNQFNGNISGTKWRSRGDGEQRAFGYGYDAANRLLYADFNQKFGSNWAKSDAGTPNYSIDFSVQMGNGTDASTAYDENGNIKKMKQWGLKLNTSSVIDDLSYTYSTNSNKLQNVIDVANEPQTVLGDFRSSQKYMTSLNNAKTNAAIDYTYDANGNLKKDLNKDIGDAATEGIEYNHLNLPYRITVRNSNGIKGTITYIYDASGNKLEKRVSDNTNAGSPYKNTTYIGGFVYESDKLQFFGQEEGRIRVKETIVSNAPVTEYIYDYFIKDHLGNTRMVLTDELQTDIYPMVSLENMDAVNFENQYYKVDAVNIVDKSAAFGLTDDIPNNNGFPTNNPHVTTTNSQKLYRLHGNGTKTGLGITLKVMAGDKVDIFGKSYWKTADGTVPGTPASIPYLDLLSSFIGAGIAGKDGITGQMLKDAPGVTGILDLLFQPQQQTTNKPKAYINWILFDENFRPVISNTNTNSGFDTVGRNGQLQSHVKTTGEILKNGYLYIYCSNESKLDVFFDNLQVVHTRGALISESHYGAWGNVLKGISSEAALKLPNKYKYNGKEEQNKEFSDGSGLEWYDYGARMYDNQISRFIGQDFFSDKYLNITPYSYVLNNPLNAIDPTGMDTHLGGLAAQQFVSALQTAFTGNKNIEVNNLDSYAESVVRQFGGDNEENFKIKAILPVYQSITPQTYRHISDAQQEGHPSILTVAPRYHNLLNRPLALSPFRGLDYNSLFFWRDEYPFASTIEGGLGASVRAVPIWEQRIQARQIQLVHNSIGVGSKYFVLPISGKIFSGSKAPAFYFVNSFGGTQASNSWIERPYFTQENKTAMPPKSFDWSPMIDKLLQRFSPFRFPIPDPRLLDPTIFRSEPVII